MKRKDEQLSLFAETAPRPPSLDPIPAPDPDIAALAARLPPRVHLGTSSWTFPGWRGLVYRRTYPNQRAFMQRSLEEYARFPLFGTVGIDRSYYAPLLPEELTAYAEQLPSGFRCVMKAFSELTTQVFPRHPGHGERAGQTNPSFLDAQLFEEMVARPVRERFLDHTACVVLEMTPSPVFVSPRAFEQQLERFFARDFGIPLAVELRDARLFNQRYLALLRAHGVAHVFNYWTRMPSLSQQLARVTETGELPGSLAVVRLMLPPGGNYEALREQYAPFDRIVDPDEEMRGSTIEIVRRALLRDMDAFVIANNKAEGSSPLTVRALAERLAI